MNIKNKIKNVGIAIGIIALLMISMLDIASAGLNNTGVNNSSDTKLAYETMSVDINNSGTSSNMASIAGFKFQVCCIKNEYTTLVDSYTIPIKVKVTDQYGKPVPKIPVNIYLEWPNAYDTDGTTINIDTHTNSLGIANYTFVTKPSRTFHGTYYLEVDVESPNMAGYTSKFTIMYPKDVMKQNTFLDPGLYKLSPNGKYKLQYQADNNLVLVRTIDNKVLWSSKTVSIINSIYGYAVIMQKDGNLTISRGDIYSCMRYGECQWMTTTWSTKTGGHPGAYLRVQNDGNVVIYDKYNKKLWATNTVQT